MVNINNIKIKDVSLETLKSFIASKEELTECAPSIKVGDIIHYKEDNDLYDCIVECILIENDEQQFKVLGYGSKNKKPYYEVGYNTCLTSWINTDTNYEVLTDWKSE